MKSEWFWLIGGVLVAVGLLLMIGGFGDTGFGLVWGDDGIQQQPRKHMHVMDMMHQCR